MVRRGLTRHGATFWIAHTGGGRMLATTGQVVVGRTNVLFFRAVHFGNFHIVDAAFDRAAGR